MVDERIADLVAAHPALESCVADIQECFERLRQTFDKGGKLLIAGNGGSAADAEHISAELLKGLAHDRPIGPDWRARLGDKLTAKLQGALPTIPLASFTSLTTAFANDGDAEYVFAQLVWALGAPDDALLAISTSGNSPNILRAVEVAKAKGMTAIGIAGKTGGELRSLVDHGIWAPATEVHRIQEYHLPIYHTLCFMLEDAFFGRSETEPR